MIERRQQTNIELPETGTWNDYKDNIYGALGSTSLGTGLAYRTVEMGISGNFWSAAAGAALTVAASGVVIHNVVTIKNRLNQRKAMRPNLG